MAQFYIELTSNACDSSSELFEGTLEEAVDHFYSLFGREVCLTFVTGGFNDKDYNLLALEYYHEDGDSWWRYVMILWPEEVTHV